MTQRNPWAVACYNNNDDDTNTTNNSSNSSSISYPPIIRMIGPLHRAIVSMHGDLLHSSSSEISHLPPNTPCTRCGSIDIQDDTCKQCGAANAMTCLIDTAGHQIGIGSFLLFGKHSQPGLVISMSRRNKTLEGLFVSVYGKLKIQRRSLTQSALIGTIAGSKSNHSDDNESDGATVFRNAKYQEMNDDVLLKLRRLLITCAEHSICGKCDQLYHIGDKLHRKIGDLEMAAKSMNDLIFKIKGLHVKKEMLLDMLKPPIHSEINNKESELKDKEEENNRENKKDQGTEGKEGEEGVEGTEGKESVEGVEKIEGKEETKSTEAHSTNEQNIMNQYNSKSITLSLNEKIKVKKQIISIANVLKDNERRLAMLHRLQRPTVFTCPKCGWLPWTPMK